MKLPPEFLDQLRACAPLQELVGRRARLQRNGRHWKACCPFHQEKTPSFYVYEDHFHCFGCGAHGDAIAFVMRTEGASFPEAVERLAASAGLDLPKPDVRQQARSARSRDLHEVLEAAARAFQRRLAAEEGAAGRAYLARRGVSAASIHRFGLGWSPGRGALTAELAAEGLDAARLVEAGLLKWRDPERPGGPTTELFFERVMFPIRDGRGRPVGFGGRTLGDGQPKYLNGPETAVFRKRECLYGLDRARPAAFGGATVIAVEGYLDVIALHQAGFEGAVAPLGTALTAEQLEALWRLSPDPVLCFDGDAAGARAQARTVLETALPLLDPGRRLRLAALGAGDDPDTLVAREGAAGVQAMLAAAVPYERRLLTLLRERTGDRTPQERAALREAIEATCRTLAHRSLAGELRAALREEFFARYRSRVAAPRARPTLARPSIDGETARLAQARTLLTLLLRHPHAIAAVEDSLMAIDWPAGPASRLAEALLKAPPLLDSAGLSDHLAAMGFEVSAWMTALAPMQHRAVSSIAVADIVPAAHHYAGLLLGHAALEREVAETRARLAVTDDVALQRRLVGLVEALMLHRSGDAFAAEIDGPALGEVDGVTFRAGAGEA